MKKNKFKQQTPKFKFDDATFVTEFPGYLRCAAECVSGRVTDYDIEDVSEYKGQVGFCQLYKGKKGHFAVFFAADLAIITTPQGIYNNAQTFHSIRSDNSLFVFEEDFSRYEEAFCIILDVSYGFHKIKERLMFQDIIGELLFGDD